MFFNRLLLITLIVINSQILLSAEKKFYTEVTTKEDFDKALSTGKPTAVKFHAPWCGWCGKMEPLFNESAKKYKDKISCCAVNVDNEKLKSLAKLHKIQGLPTTVFYDKNGKEVKRERGGITSQAELDSIFDTFLNGPKSLIIRSKEAPAKKK